MTKRSIEPSKDEPLNLLVEAKRSVEEGSSPEEIFYEALDLFTDYFEKSGRNFRRLLKSTKDLEVHQELEALLSGYQEAKQALIDLHDFCIQKAYDNMSASFFSLQNFLDPYFDICQKISMFPSEADPGTDAKQCPRCSRMNSTTAWGCKSCGFIFPNTAEADSPSRVEIKEGGATKGQFRITGNIEKLLDAVEDFEDGEITHSDFVSVLDWMNKILGEGVEAIASRKKDLRNAKASLSEQINTIVESYAAGVAELQAGISALMAWSESRSDAQLRDGMGLCVSGAQKVFQGKSLADTAGGEYGSEEVDFEEHFGGIA